MTQDEIDAFLRMGVTEDEITELLRQQERFEGQADETRGRSYLTDAGRGISVANPLGAISDMFVRGNSERKAKAAADQIPNKRADLNEKAGDYYRAAMGLGLGGVDLNRGPSQASIAGSAPLSVPPPPQVPPAPQAAPSGPQAPVGPIPPPGPAPAPPPTPMAPPPQPVRTASGAFPSPLDTGPPLAPEIPGMEDDAITAEIAALLRQQGQR